MKLSLFYAAANLLAFSAAENSGLRNLNAKGPKEHSEKNIRGKAIEKKSEVR